ncbi:GntR family transcriptional regulator [Actinoallomurus purpureus]|uniref:GntR family transcriptional regulator n=1 Tax=Actinoallomurus purpureus TaxID=478114 RepID=UPI002092B9F7|nr:GntR family transcriptional regulator [Actinoallomurus purpureus]MCO6007989.1 GntR family transcriptional regulator [Actinoallomurus purpureus]
MSEPVPSGGAEFRADAGTAGPAKVSVRESVFQSLKALLMDHDLEPGARLSIDGLARQLEVSQTPVREALARCESEGLVVRRPNAGYLVASLLDQAGLDDLYDVRLLLEPAAAARAADHATPAEVAEMRHTLDQMTPALRGDTYQAYRGFAELDAAFHNAIAQASRSPLIADTLRRFRAHTHGYRLFFRHGIAGHAVDEHRAVLAAIERGDPEAAAAAMRDHLETSRSRLKSAYRE